MVDSFGVDEGDGGGIVVRLEKPKWPNAPTPRRQPERARERTASCCAATTTTATRSAREELIERHLPLVRSLARRYAGRGEALEDIEQVGAIGLIKAIDRFELDRGVSLATYATPNVVGEIKRHFRDKGWAIRVPRALQELNVQLSGTSSGSPAARALADDRRDRGGAKDDAGGGAGGDGERPRATPRLAVGRATARRGRARPARDDRHGGRGVRAVRGPRGARAGLPRAREREREILQMRFVEGLTQTQIAQRVGISQMHVSRLIRRSLEKIRDEIAADEEAPAPRRRAATS